MNVVPPPVLQNTMYEIYPVIEEMKCDKSKLTDNNSLMGQGHADANSPRPMQADDDKPHLGFVSLQPNSPPPLPTPPKPPPPPPPPTHIHPTKQQCVSL